MELSFTPTIFIAPKARTNHWSRQPLTGLSPCRLKKLERMQAFALQAPAAVAAQFHPLGGKND